MKRFTNSEIHAIQQYFHETESRQSEGRPQKGQEKIRSDSEQIIDGELDHQPEETEQEEGDRPIDKTAEITGKSPSTVSKINQIMEMENN